MAIPASDPRIREKEEISIFSIYINREWMFSRFAYLPSDLNPRQTWNRRKIKMQRRAAAGGPISNVFIENREKIKSIFLYILA